MLKNLYLELREYVKKSDNFFIKALADFYVFLFVACRRIKAYSSLPIFYFCRLLPLQDKIVATSYNGKKYGDNPQFIVEQVHKLFPKTKIVWLKDSRYKYSTPDYIKNVSYYNYWRSAYELATAKVWINSHRFDIHIQKRPNQFFIETWHGGLGVKKVVYDNEKFHFNKIEIKKLKKTNLFADIFISNSKHLTDIYSRAFKYTGPIWAVGYPKNDILFKKEEIVTNHQKIRAHFSLPQESKILVYAPTFRGDFERSGIKNDIYSLNYNLLQETLNSSTNQSWNILVRFHPLMTQISKILLRNCPNVIDATQYPDSQELILGSDAFISDYSSIIFDAAMANIPCFTFATDYTEYKEERGLYYNLEDLPFPLATTNDELITNITNFDKELYLKKWTQFKKDMGLVETNHSAKDIALLIDDVMKNGKSILKNYTFKS